MASKISLSLGLLSLVTLLFVLPAKTARAAGYTSSTIPEQTITYAPRQLPKTGPSLAWLALIFLIPLGLRLKQFGRQSEDSLTE